MQLCSNPYFNSCQRAPNGISRRTKTNKMQKRWQRISDGETVSPEPNEYELETSQRPVEVIRDFWKDSENSDD